MHLYIPGEVSILIATDVASRGLDIKDITQVYSYLSKPLECRKKNYYNYCLACIGMLSIMTFLHTLKIMFIELVVQDELGK